MNEKELKTLEDLLSKLANMTMDYRTSHTGPSFSHIRDLMKKLNK